MLRRLFAGMVGFVLGAAAMWAAFAFHVVHAETGWLLVSKATPGLKHTICDVRGWGFSQWRDHPHLARALNNAGHGELVEKGVAIGLIDEVIDQLVPEPGSPEAAEVRELPGQALAPVTRSGRSSRASDPALPPNNSDTPAPGPGTSRSWPDWTEADPVSGRGSSSSSSNSLAPGTTDAELSPLEPIRRGRRPGS